MLTWDAKELPEWQKFKGWHDEVAASTGFAATQVSHSYRDFVSTSNTIQ